MTEAAARRDARGRLPAVHHRRRRHRPRRRRARAQPDPPLRRGRACPGYHIEDQKPGAKKCGHQGGKVLVAEDEQIKRLNAARFQLDIMGVPGIIVARTDAEAANLLDGRGDERDQPFILGATNRRRAVATRPATWRSCARSTSAGVEELSGHLLYAISRRGVRRRRRLARAGGRHAAASTRRPSALASEAAGRGRRRCSTTSTTRSSTPGRPRPA